MKREDVSHQSIKTYFDAFHACWVSGTTHELCEWYDKAYEGIYLEQKIHINDVINRIHYNRHHYSDISFQVLSVSESGHNKYLVLVLSSAFHKTLKQTSEVITSTLYELKNQKILKTSTVSDKAVDFTLSVKDKEDLTIETALKAKLLDQISHFIDAHLLDINVTPKELACLYHYLLGHPLKVIGVKLNVEASTIETHLRRLTTKLGLKSKSALKQVFTVS